MLLKFAGTFAEARAVFDAMNTVHFEVGGQSFSYGGFYRGFGLSCTVSMLLSAFLSWHLGQLARSAPASIGLLGWVFFAVQIAGGVLSFLYLVATDGAHNAGCRNHWTGGISNRPMIPIDFCSVRNQSQDSG